MRLIRDGEKGGRGYGGRGRGLYLSLHCHHQNDFCIKMGSNESHFNVSQCRNGDVGQSHKTVSTNHNLSEEKGEPKRYRTEVLPLADQAMFQLPRGVLLIGILFNSLCVSPLCGTARGPRRHQRHYACQSWINHSH